MGFSAMNANWRAGPRPASFSIGQSASFQVGQFAYLPRIPGKHASSIINGQLPHVNGGAIEHPLLIVGSKDNGKIVTCLQTTSFNDTPIQVKYHSRALEMLEQYIAIDHHGKTPQHSSLPVLRIADNNMSKQTYVNLDQFFTIEAAHLLKWRDGKRQLDTASIKNLEEAFLAFVDKRLTRRLTQTTMWTTITPNFILSPIDYREPDELTADWLGVNDTRFIKPPRKDSAVAITPPQSPTPNPNPRRSQENIPSNVQPRWKCTSWRWTTSSE